MKIFPVDVGRDGWSVFYDTPAKRILFLCGLRFNMRMVNGKDRYFWHVRHLAPGLEGEELS